MQIMRLFIKIIKQAKLYQTKTKCERQTKQNTRPKLECKAAASLLTKLKCKIKKNKQLNKRNVDGKLFESLKLTTVEIIRTIIK